MVNGFVEIRVLNQVDVLVSLRRVSSRKKYRKESRRHQDCKLPD